MKKTQPHRTSTKDKKNIHKWPTEIFNPPSKAPIQDKILQENFRNFKPPKRFLPQVVMIK